MGGVSFVPGTQIPGSVVCSPEQAKKDRTLKEPVKDDHSTWYGCVTPDEVESLNQAAGGKPLSPEVRRGLEEAAKRFGGNK